MQWGRATRLEEGREGTVGEGGDVHGRKPDSRV